MDSQKIELRLKNNGERCCGMSPFLIDEEYEGPVGPMGVDEDGEGGGAVGTTPDR